MHYNLKRCIEVKTQWSETTKGSLLAGKPKRRFSGLKFCKTVSPKYSLHDWPRVCSHPGCIIFSKFPPACASGSSCPAIPERPRQGSCLLERPPPLSSNPHLVGTPLGSVSCSPQGPLPWASKPQEHTHFSKHLICMTMVCSLFVSL